MKILIATAWYYPFIHPRAHRWTAIAEQWAKEGHAVHVLTARIQERRQSEVLQSVQVHRVGFDSLKEWVYYLSGSRQARGRVGVKPKKANRWARIAAWVYKNIWKNLVFPDDACVWYFPAKRKLRQLLQVEHFDVVITVSLPFTGHLLGLLIREWCSGRADSAGSSPKIPFWLADIGDPFSIQGSRPNNLFLYRHKNRRLEQKILETADAVTVTTEATLRQYRTQLGEKAVAKMRVVPPLFTPIKPTNPPITNPPITKLGYFGALYAPTRTPDALLDLLRRTFAIHPDWSKRIEVHFYGEIFPEFFEKLNAEPSIRLHGLCSREVVQQAMQEMDILLNIGNTTDFQLPSKAVDYLASGKPVLNLSYVEQDPFVGIFEGSPQLFSLKVENSRVGELEFGRWLDWMYARKTSLSEAEIAKYLEPFLLGKIGKQYVEITTPEILF